MIPRKIKSKFTLQDSKRLYASESNACKFYGNELPALGTVDCFFYLGFISPAFTIHRTVGEGDATSLTHLYHFHLLHRNLDVSQAITADSSPLRILSMQT